MTHATRFIAWLVLTAYGLSAGVFGLGAVLCFEADGHVSLEMTGPEEACDSCCPEEGARGAAACECEDVRLGAEQDASRKLEHEVVVCVLDQLWTVPTGVLARDAGRPTPRLVPRVEREPRALALVRCTVLRL